MLKKLSKAFKIAKAAKEIKDIFKEPKTSTEELVDRFVSDPEPYNAEDEIREAVKDFYQPSEKQLKEAAELGFTPFEPNPTQGKTNIFAYAVQMLPKNTEGNTIKAANKVTLPLPEILPDAIKEAKWAASLSPCQKAKVGAAIFSDDKILAVGFNTNTMAVACDSVQCQVAGKNNSTNCGTVHAEIVAIQNLQDSEFLGWQKYIYCTHFPCTACLHQIISQGITQVFYGQENYFTADLARLFPEVTFTQA